MSLLIGTSKHAHVLTDAYAVQADPRVWQSTSDVVVLQLKVLQLQRYMT